MKGQSEQRKHPSAAFSVAASTGVPIASARPARINATRVFISASNGKDTLGFSLDEISEILKLTRAGPDGLRSSVVHRARASGSNRRAHPTAAVLS
jgi:hypothetical protein